MRRAVSIICKSQTMAFRRVGYKPFQVCGVKFASTSSSDEIAAAARAAQASYDESAKLAADASAAVARESDLFNNMSTFSSSSTNSMTSDFLGEGSGQLLENVVLDSSLSSTVALELSKSNPGHWIMEGIDKFHMMADIPYWQSIIILTIALRCCLFPLYVLQMKNQARLEIMKPEMSKIQAEMANDPLVKQGDKQANEKYKSEMQALFLKHKFVPLRSILVPFVQLPIFIYCFTALREMHGYFPGLSSGGLLWFQDLSIADPTYALPLINAVSFPLMVEIGADEMKKTDQGKMMLNFMRGMAVVSVPMTASMPAALFVHWMASNSCTLGQTLLMKTQGAKAFFDVPIAPVSKATPTPPSSPSSSSSSFSGKSILDIIKEAQREAIAAQQAPAVTPPTPTTTTTAASAEKSEYIYRVEKNKVS